TQRVSSLYRNVCYRSSFMTLLPSSSTLFPYTTLFRSRVDAVDGVTGAQVDAPAAVVRRAEHVEDRRDDRRHERVDDCGERGTDDDRDRQLDHVASHDEVLEPLDHRASWM